MHTDHAPKNPAESTVIAYYAAVDEGDTEGLVQLFDQDATYNRPGYDPIIGRTALTEFYNGTRVIASGDHTLNTVLSDESQVAVAGTFNGRLKDGREITQNFADFFLFAGDLIVQRQTYFDAPAI